MKRLPLTVALLLLLACVAVGTAGAEIIAARASGPTPFSAGCTGVPPQPPNTIVYPNAEVEPWISVNPRDTDNRVGVWQQDRWSDGGANGLLTGVTHDGGRSWTRTFAHFSRCAGGNAGNGGNYERASDPWVAFSPNGAAHQISLSFDTVDGNQAVLVSRSSDGGNHWSEPLTLARDTDFDIGLDKESLTADPHNARFVYAVWDRLTGLTSTNPNDFRGPIWFARTTNGGASWEPARMIFDPGPNAQTIANQIVVLPNGTLVNVFDVIVGTDASVAVIRSTDRGVTWSPPVIVSADLSLGAIDVKTGEPIRVGNNVPTIAADAESGALYVVWEDARFSGGVRDGILLSKSTNGGLTWSAPTQVNKATRVQAFTGAVNVAADGTVGVSYYDFRNDTADPNTLLTSTWLSVSNDGGQSWHETRIARPFDMRTAPFALGYFVGDYEALATLGESFLPFFVKANSGNLANRTDVFAVFGDEQGDSVTNRVETNANPPSLKERVKAHRERGSH